MLVTCAIVVVTACGDEPEQRRAARAPAGTAPVSAAQSGIPLEPRYAATLAEGIDFTKHGFPDFVKEVSGLSGHESWGRWTDANVAPAVRIRFKQPLPARFTLELRAHGLGPNAFNPVTLRAGNVERSVLLGDPPKASYRVVFEGTAGADTIEIVPPQPIFPREITPANPDPRRLGVGLTTLRILD